MTTYKWYFVRCQSGREDSIRKQLETRIRRQAGLAGHRFRRSWCPSSASPSIKSGKRKVVSKQALPGLPDGAGRPLQDHGGRARRGGPFAPMRETPGFGDFLGSRGEAGAPHGSSGLEHPGAHVGQRGETRRSNISHVARATWSRSSPEPSTASTGRSTRSTPRRGWCKRHRHHLRTPDPGRARVLGSRGRLRLQLAFTRGCLIPRRRAPDTNATRSES